MSSSVYIQVQVIPNNQNPQKHHHYKPPIKHHPSHQTNNFMQTILVTKQYNTLMNSDCTNQFQLETKVESRQSAQK